MDYPKRLIEVDLPIKRISAHARREKSIRHGHISTLHIWWARRPLAACRAVICAALWPDPADEKCPQAFRDEARRLMTDWAANHLDLTSSESMSHFNRVKNDPKVLADNFELRKALFNFIADFSDWDNATDQHYLEAGRRLTTAAHQQLAGEKGERPIVLDPFAGGGSIPLEALRLGADAVAGDLNPVAVLMNRVITEYVPKFGDSLREDVKKWGSRMGQLAKERLGQLFPNDPDGSIPIAYLWARTARCEGPGCGKEVPMVSNLWLANKGAHKVRLKPTADADKGTIAFEVINNPQSTEQYGGFVKRGSLTCPLCGYTTPAVNVRNQFAGRSAGAFDSRMIAVVTTDPVRGGRRYRPATDQDVAVAQKATALLATLSDEHSGHFSFVPDEALPYLRSIFNIHLLSAHRWGDLFNARQAVTNSFLASLVPRLFEQELLPGLGKERAVAVATLLAFAVDKQIDSNSSLCAWRSSSQDIGHTFGRQALPIIWDYVEANVFSGATRDWANAVEGVAKGLESCRYHAGGAGQCIQQSATEQTLPDDFVGLIATDPPYYDLVPYADLSDFFYVWLKRMVGGIQSPLFDEVLSPKKLETVQLAERNSEYAYKTKNNYERLMSKAMEECRRILTPDGLSLVFFAHKETGPWESQLEAMVESGWVIHASWPIDTEMGSRLRARNSGVLAASVCESFWHR